MLHQSLDEKYILLRGGVDSDDGLIEEQFLHFELPFNHHNVLRLDSLRNAVDLYGVSLRVEVGGHKLLGHRS